MTPFVKKTAGLVIITILLFCLPLAAGPRKRTARVKKVAVWQLRTLGLDESRARRVDYELNRAFGRLRGFSLLPAEKVQIRLKKKRVAADATAVKVARVLRVNWLLTGTLGGLGDQISLDLRLLDGRTGEQVRQAAVNLPLATAERRSALDEILVRLLDPTRWVGSLALDVTVEGAEVHLDGKRVATAPLEEPISGLAPGKHILRITRKGYDDFSKFVLIRYNQVARLKVDLKNAMVVGLLYERKPPEVPVEEEPAPPVPQPGEGIRPAGSDTFRVAMAWTLLGVGAGLTGCGIYFGVASDRKVLTAIMSASGGVLLAGSVTLFLIGIGNDSASETEEADLSLFSSPSPEGGFSLGLMGRF